jgi:hypothetical protein
VFSPQAPSACGKLKTMSLTDAAADAASGTSNPTNKPLDQLSVDTIRTLAMDAVQAELTRTLRFSEVYI